MKKTQAIKRSAATGRFVLKPLGKGKASKFLKVEGMTLTAESTSAISNFEGQGLKGDALRAAISQSFVARRGC